MGGDGGGTRAAKPNRRQKHRDLPSGLCLCILQSGSVSKNLLLALSMEVNTATFFKKKKAGQKWLIYCSKGTFGGWHQRSVTGEVGFLIRCSPVAAPALELKGWSTASV